MGNERINIFLEQHIGFGVRWDTDFYTLQLSIAFPFITVTIGFGKEK